MTSQPAKETLSAFRSTEAQDRPLAAPSRWQPARAKIVAALAVLAVCVIAATAILRLAGASRSFDRSRLTLATVERGSFVRDLDAEGRIVAAVSPTVYATAAGTVTLKVNAGDTVRKDQVMAIVNSPQVMASLAQEEATLQGLYTAWQRARLEATHSARQLADVVARARIDNTTAEREADRSRTAYEAGAYSELQYLRAQDALEKARSALAQAVHDFEAQPERSRFDVGSARAMHDRQNAVVGELRRQVDGLNVLSPANGQVGQVEIADRTYVAKDAPLLSVVDLSALEVEIKVAEYVARDLQPGMRAAMQGSGGTWQGVVGSVSPAVVNGHVSARLRFLDASLAGLRQGQRLSVRVLVDRREDVLMVERGAFVDAGGGVAYVVRDDTAQRRRIRTGAVSVEKVEILDGLRAGEQIVVSGTDAFNDAERIVLTR